MILVGIDIGGTFTDLIIYNSENNETTIVKVPTTARPENGVVTALGKIGERQLENISGLYHATTIATNTLLTRQGLAKTALVTNHGFRDILEIARQRRPEIYNLHTERPLPLIPRKDRYTVRGRILSNGQEYEALSINQTWKIAKKIIRDNYDAVAISFLHSYKNPSHEIKTRNIFRRAGFNGHVDISSEINPEYREYERTSTTVVNAVLAKLVSSYLTKLTESINKIGIRRDQTYVMKSDGTVAPIQQITHNPVSIIESGPAAGVLASQHLTKTLHLKKVITFDMGGTTAKASAIINGLPDTSYEFEAGGRTYHGRSLKGSGYAVRQPFIDLAEVSSGGGTIAWVDETNMLRLGPQSAGATPGPVAYGKGNTQPTVTDANIVTGRINPRKLLGGRLRLHHRLALESLKNLGKKLHINPTKASLDIIRLANHNMAKALSLVSSERGRDPREFTLLAFGGAGPLHACELAQEIGIRQIIVPPHPGMFSAFGLLTSKIARSFSKAIAKTLDGSPEKYFKPFRLEIQKNLTREALASKYDIVESIDLRYKGQAYEINIPYRNHQNLQRQFNIRHKQLYGYSSKDPIEIVNIRLKVILDSPTIRPMKRYARTQTRVVSPHPLKRRVRFQWGDVRIPIYNRTHLNHGTNGKGPCIIEEYDSTILIQKSWTYSVDALGNLYLKTRH